MRRPLDYFDFFLFAQWVCSFGSFLIACSVNINVCTHFEQNFKVVRVISSLKHTPLYENKQNEIEIMQWRLLLCLVFEWSKSVWLRNGFRFPVSSEYATIVFGIQKCLQLLSHMIIQMNWMPKKVLTSNGPNIWILGNHLFDIQIILFFGYKVFRSLLYKSGITQFLNGLINLAIQRWLGLFFTRGMVCMLTLQSWS